MQTETKQTKAKRNEIANEEQQQQSAEGMCRISEQSVAPGGEITRNDYT